MSVLHKLHCCFRWFLFSAFVIGWCQGTCPPADPNDATLITYVPINETLYDRTPADIGSGRNPLGFYSSIVYYQQQSATTPCIKITNANDAKIEIKAETVPTRRLCVKDQTSEKQCFQGRFVNCYTAPTDTLYIEFLCDNNCEQADVNFWYRLVLSPPSAEDWCMGRDNLYPGDLASLPTGITLPPITTPAPGGGGTGGAPSIRVLPSGPLLLGIAVTLKIILTAGAW